MGKRQMIEVDADIAKRLRMKKEELEFKRISDVIRYLLDNPQLKKDIMSVDVPMTKEEEDFWKDNTTL